MPLLYIYLSLVSNTFGKQHKNFNSGAGGRIRTRDPRITSAVLYQLSYSSRLSIVRLFILCVNNLFSNLACPEGFEPPTHSLEGCCSNPTELRADYLFSYIILLKIYLST